MRNVPDVSERVSNVSSVQVTVIVVEATVPPNESCTTPVSTRSMAWEWALIPNAMNHSTSACGKDIYAPYAPVVSGVKCESVMDFANFETGGTSIVLQETVSEPVDVTDLQLTAG